MEVQKYNVVDCHYLGVRSHLPLLNAFDLARVLRNKYDIFIGTFCSPRFLKNRCCDILYVFPISGVVYCDAKSILWCVVIFIWVIQLCILDVIRIVTNSTEYYVVP